MHRHFQDLVLGAGGVNLRVPLLFTVQNGESEETGGTRLLPVAHHCLIVMKHELIVMKHELIVMKHELIVMKHELIVMKHEDQRCNPATLVRIVFPICLVQVTGNDSEVGCECDPKRMCHACYANCVSFLEHNGIVFVKGVLSNPCQRDSNLWLVINLPR